MSWLGIIPIVFHYACCSEVLVPLSSYEQDFQKFLLQPPFYHGPSSFYYSLPVQKLLPSSLATLCRTFSAYLKTAYLSSRNPSLEPSTLARKSHPTQLLPWTPSCTPVRRFCSREPLQPTASNILKTLPISHQPIQPKTLSPTLKMKTMMMKTHLPSLWFSTPTPKSTVRPT